MSRSGSTGYHWPETLGTSVSLSAVASPSGATSGMGGEDRESTESFGGSVSRLKADAEYWRSVVREAENTDVCRNKPSLVRRDGLGREGPDF